MRVLVTRPSDQAARTAKRLLALGHRPFCAPALEIVPIAAAPPDGPFDLILATSAQAFAGWPPSSALRAAPLFCVGEKTAEAGRALGLRVAFTAPRAEALAERLGAEKLPKAALYLAGRERKPLLEESLRAGGWRLSILETYDSRPVASWPPEIDSALAEGEIDAVLHFSARSAAAALALIGAASAASLLHYCLSEDVAAICRNWAPLEEIFTAFQADEESLMNLLGPSGRPGE
jgi:uroporphyrinogen-III synthase